MKDAAFYLSGLNVLAIVFETRYEGRFDHITIHAAIALFGLFVVRFAERAK